MPDTATPAAMLARLQRTFRAGRTLGLDWRRGQLERLDALLRDDARGIADALAKDLGKSGFEAHLTETAFVRQEIATALSNLRRWARPRRVPVPFAVRPGRGEIHACPYGTALILSPWNYPVQLALVPLVSALAAGNCIVLKPSELAPASAAWLAARLPQILDPDAVAVATGGPDVAAALTALPFDTIFFTGGAAVGRKVLAAAAPNLVPVTLELGGKSPCIVEATADVGVAARRIVWGKFLNAGQTCVAPDYVLVDRRVEAPFVRACVEAVRASFGEDPRASPDYGRIVNEAHLSRLVALLEGGTVATGAQVDRASRYLAPTILRDVAPDHAVMREEIFGPILPILAVDSLDEAIAFVNARPAPLALYCFSRSRDAQRAVLRRTRSGGACVNDVILHLAPSRLPFGGVGASGMGACHGKAGFDAFTHRRSVLVRGTGFDPAVRYPPYRGWVKRMLGFRETPAPREYDLTSRHHIVYGLMHENDFNP